MGKQLSQKAINASPWVIGAHVANQLLRFGGHLILARILFPEVFGIMALLMALHQGFEMFTDMGVHKAVARSKRYRDPEFLNTAWTIQIIRGLLLYIMAVVTASPIAQWLGHPEFAYYLPVSALTLLLGGAASTKLFIWRREMREKDIAFFALGNQICGLVVMISLSIYWPSPWSLICGQLTSSIVRLVRSHLIYADIPHRFRLEGEAVYNIVHFGKWIFLSTLVYYFATQIDRVLLGKLVSLEFLGLYAIAKNLTQPAIALMQRFEGGMFFSMLSTKYHEGSSVKTLLAKYRVLVVLPTMALLSLLAGLSTPLVELLYDSRYHGSAWILTALAAVIGMTLPYASMPVVALSKGESRYPTFVSLGQVAFLLLGLFSLGSNATAEQVVMVVIASEVVRGIGNFMIAKHYKLLQGRLEMMMLGTFALVLGFYYINGPAQGMLDAVMRGALVTAIWGSVFWYYKELYQINLPFLGRKARPQTESPQPAGD